MYQVLGKTILIISDFIALFFIFFITELLLSSNVEIKNFIFAFTIVYILFVFEKIYKFRYDFWQETLKVYKALFVSFLIILASLSINSNNKLDTKFIILYFILSLIIVPINKRLTKWLLYKKNTFKQKTNIIGNKKNVNEFIKEINNNWYLGLQYNPKVYSSIVIASKGLKTSQLNKLIESNLHLNKEIFIVPYLDNINSINSNILEYSNIRKNLIQLENKLLSKKNIYLKTILDIVLIFITLPVFLLLHIFILLLIKLDSKGPIFFKQQRVGKNGKIFFIYKYRTMYINSDKLLEDYLAKNPEEIKYYHIYHKYKNDPRITKIGKFLRVTSLDELPQIINIIKSEMSFVGPRPYMKNELKLLKQKRKFILKVKPGITGLWQVNGRNNLTFRERINLENWYIKNWSLWLDFVIIVKTIKVIFNKVGAK